MLKKSIYIIILLQLLSLLDACCKKGTFAGQWVRFNMEILDLGKTSIANPQDSIHYLHLGAQVNLVDSTTRIAALNTGLTLTAMALSCEPLPIQSLTSMSAINIFTLTDLANQVPAQSDVTNLFIDQDFKVPLDSTRRLLNEENRFVRDRSFFRIQFQPPFAVHQVCRFRVEIKMSDGRVMRKETGDLKLF